MVKHVILWNLKDEYTPEEKQAIRLGIKEGLEGLAGRIPGLLDIQVKLPTLATSTADVMLDSSFESAEALAGYSKNPLHVEVANTKVRPYTKARACLDFEV